MSNQFAMRKRLKIPPCNHLRHRKIRKAEHAIEPNALSQKQGPKFASLRHLYEINRLRIYLPLRQEAVMHRRPLISADIMLSGLVVVETFERPRIKTLFSQRLRGRSRLNNRDPKTRAAAENNERNSVALSPSRNRQTTLRLRFSKF